MLGELPPNILHRILSFLPTRKAIQTCVLSSRWRHLWKSVLCLNMDGDDFPRHIGTAPSDGDDSIEPMLFPRFVSHVMASARASQFTNLRAFRLCVIEGPGVSLDEDYGLLVCLWVFDALAAGVREIELHLGIPERAPSVNEILLRAGSLEVLKLDFNNESTIIGSTYWSNTILVPSRIYFDSLRTLHISNAQSGDGFGMPGFSSLHSLELLIRRCPVLEELLLSHCYTRGLNIDLPNLRRLVLLDTEDRQHEIKVRAPKLQHLHYVGRSELMCSLVGPSSLISATVNLRTFSDYYANLGEGIHAVRTLSLAFAGAKKPQFSEEQHRVFQNLRTLKIFTNFTADESIQAIIFLLLHSPRLEALEIQNEMIEQRKRRDEDWNLELMPTNCLPYLKKVKIDGYKRTPKGEELIKFLASNAKALEEWTINLQ